MDEEMRNTQEFLETCLKKNIAFYAFSRPGIRELEFGAQTNSKPFTYVDLNEIGQHKGFVFAPFHQNHSSASFFIRSEINTMDISAFRRIQKLDSFDACKEHPIHESTREEYHSQIEAMIHELKTAKLDKVILSRIHVLENKGREDAAFCFLNLNMTYLDAFVFMVNLPESGLWVGATPERLLRIDDSQIETMALAGTQKLQLASLEQIQWEEKEREEQAYVSKYIEDLLVKYKANHYQKEGPFTAQAGNLVHLKTSFRIENNLSEEQICNFVQALHPTPAVCGLPKDKALDLILKLENHDREYYAGYLGPIDGYQNMSLFVNLRSMKVLQNKMALYVGGGITAASDPDKEWEETCFKAQTLLNVIK